jgi:DUF1680 family protein
VVNAVADIYRALPADQQKLGGIIGARLRANGEGYIERIVPSLSGGTPEQTGVLLAAAVYMFEYNRDPQTNKVMLGLLRKILASQAADGYLGPRANPAQWSEQDTWNQSAELDGLLSYYRVTGDQAALSAATKAANLLLKERHASKDAASFAGAIEPMVQLFRFTDDNKYLDFCSSIAEAWLHAKPPELPATDKELLVLNGLVELHRVNGDNSVVKIPLQAWTEMEASAFTLTGVPNSDSGDDSEAVNACTTAAWVQLSANLFRLTGQPVYVQQLERTIYNQLFAGQDGKTGAVLAPVSWSGKKEPANNGVCAAREVRALAQLPGIVWGRYGNGVAVNLYTDGRATMRLRRRGTIQFYSEANYPESGAILLHVEPDHPIHFPLRLRVPDWTTAFTADVGRDHLVGKPGDFLTLNRNWTRGDTVRISMTMNVRVIPGVRKFSAEVAIARGPQVLALGKTPNPEIADLNAVSIDGLNSSSLQVAPLSTNYAANWMGDQAYGITGTYDGRRRQIVLVPFADAVNYRVWLAQSKASSGASGR